MSKQVIDYGVDLNKQIARAGEEVLKYRRWLERAEEAYEELHREREEAREECGKCNDCSMCLGEIFRLP